MGTYVSQTWHGNAGALRARDRRGGRFNAYVPHLLEDWQPLLPADVVAFMAEAEQTLVDASRRLKPHAGGDICFWAESLGSSRIEGVAPSAGVTASLAWAGRVLSRGFGLSTPTCCAHCSMDYGILWRSMTPYGTSWDSGAKGN